MVARHMGDAFVRRAGMKPPAAARLVDIETALCRAWRSYSLIREWHIKHAATLMRRKMS